MNMQYAIAEAGLSKSNKRHLYHLKQRCPNMKHYKAIKFMQNILFKLIGE